MWSLKNLKLKIFLTLKLTPEQLQIPPVKDGIEVIPEIRIAA